MVLDLLFPDLRLMIATYRGAHRWASQLNAALCGVSRYRGYHSYAVAHRG